MNIMDGAMKRLIAIRNDFPQGRLKVVQLCAACIGVWDDPAA